MWHCSSYGAEREGAAGLGTHSFREGLKAQPFLRAREDSGIKASVYQVGFFGQETKCSNLGVSFNICTMQCRKKKIHTRTHIHFTATQQVEERPNNSATRQLGNDIKLAKNGGKCCLKIIALANIKAQII